MRSNESLFSLHTGNPSFTTEQLNWMSKSDEYYFYNDSPLCSPLPPSTPWNKMSAAEFASQALKLPDKVVTQTSSATEIQKQKQPTQRGIKNIGFIRSMFIKNSLSHPVCDVHQELPDARVKSFAFPILIGDASENGSPLQSTEKQSQQECSTGPPLELPRHFRNS
ncbi:uncharacterized protein LOC120200078 [Hibiscus syriacus]|uniref:uncharacterized protein LOC120200078 n=1 Tax=Hibiscus syriacus TaxID=106335 RepID=UPI001920D694|nr:uncharacterized protein LOC120200078 [Hibiscus syriacus]